MPIYEDECGNKIESQAELNDAELMEAFGGFGQQQSVPAENAPTNQSLLDITGQTVEGAGSRLSRGQEMARAISPYARPVLEVGGGIGGGLVGGAAGVFGANPASVGLGAALGGGLGYAGGRGIANVIDEYAGLKKPPTFTEAAKGTAEDIAFGAANEMTGQVAGPILSATARGIGKVVKPALGKLTGAGTGAIDEAVKSGLQGTRAFKDAMRGNISGEEIVDITKSAVNSIKEQRGIDYRRQLESISQMTSDLDTAPIADRFTVLLNKYNIKINADGTLNTSRAAMDKRGIKDIEGVYETLKSFGTQPGDRTPLGLDILKRQLGDFYSESSGARAFVSTLENSVKDTIVKNVPEYAQMTKGYSEATKLIADIDSALMTRKQGLTGRIVADQTLRRLVSSMKDNFELRRDLVRALGDQSGQDIQGLAAGYAMRSTMPIGLSGSIPSMASITALAKFVSPAFLPVLAASSPRLSAEFLRLFGKGLREAGAFNQTFTAPAVKTGGILLRDQTQ